MVLEHTQNQRERLNYLEFRVMFTGQVSRSDLITRFGISEAAATRDLAIYRARAPENLTFDKTLKFYRISNCFEPTYLKDLEAKRLLHALMYGVGNDFGIAPETFIPCEHAGPMLVPTTEVLAAVSRAIFQKTALCMEYLSGSGNHGPREIVPFTFANTGLKWMVRAYCRRNGEFRHFVLNRIKSAEVLWNSKPGEGEGRENDSDWNRIIKLELIPHPASSADKRAMVAQEFRMVDGVFNLRVRAALAGFVLRLLNVDCSENQNRRFHPLGLRNRLVLHDVENANLAPGYIEGGDVKS